MTTPGHAKGMAEPATPVGPTVLAAWTSTLVRALDDRGIDGLALAQAAGIDPSVFDVSGARIPLTCTTELWRLAIEATGDPCLGLDVSEYVRPNTFHALSLGVAVSASVQEALDRMVRFSMIVLNTSMESAGSRQGSRFVYTSKPLRGVVAPAHEAVEAIMACTVRAARFLGDHSVSPCEVRLMRPDAPSSSRFESFFRCPVRYGSDHYRTTFDAAVVSRPLGSPSADLARTADRLSAEYIERVRKAGAVANQVRETVDGLLGIEEPTPSAVASRLAMSPRTLQRKLQLESTTFRDVVAEARISRAKQLMAADHLGADVIARRLGFSDASAFRRAFKRRTGMTAGEFAAHRR